MSNNVFTQSFLDGLRPDEDLTVTEWADKYRKLSSKASSEPGQWKTARTPYLKEIMDCLSPQSPVQEVVFMKGTQVGGSESGFNWLGYIISHSPGPTMMVQPTIDLAKKISKQRVQPMLEECPVFEGKIAPSKARDSGNTQLEKSFPGGVLFFSGANSAASLRSSPIKNLFLDEVDAYPLDCEGEGAPVELAEKRTTNFPRRKVFKVSTPTISGQSVIEAAFEESDQRYYHVPCPHCKELQKLKFSNLTWEKSQGSRVKDVAYVCEHCGELIAEHHKTWMLSKGVWIPENPDSSIAGFHLNALYSPIGWLSWTQIVIDWNEAQKDVLKLKVFVNTVLGETWKEKGELPEWQRIYERRERYELNELPANCLFLTAAIDVQSNRLECEIKAWGRGKENWSIDYRVWDGDPADDQVWRNATALLGETWRHPSGLDIPIKVLAVDSGGHHTQKVYDWAKKQDRQRVMVVKGSSSNSPKALIESISPIEMNLRGKRLKTGLLLHIIGTGIAKDELYGWLKQNPPTESEMSKGYPPGFCHYPNYQERFFQGLCSEQKVAKKIKGFTVYYWEKIFDRNEPLDLHVYNRAAAAKFGIDRFSEQMWSKLEAEMGVVRTQPQDEGGPTPPVQSITQKKKINIPRKRSSFW